MIRRGLFFIAKFAVVMFGFFMMGLGIVLLKNASLGVAPWDVLHLGITNLTGVNHGQVSQLVGIVLIASSYFLGVKPHIGTVLNMFFVGLFIDLIDKLNWFSPQELLTGQLLLFSLGIIFFGMGVGIYISGNLGAGPRDALMLGLCKLTGKRVAIIRNLMEITVVLIGTVMGGPLGLGTIAFALLVGPVVEINLNLFKRLFDAIPVKENFDKKPGKYKGIS